MTTFVEALLAEGVELRVDGDRIYFRPPDAPDELCALIRKHREAIIVELRGARAIGAVSRRPRVSTPTLADVRDPFEPAGPMDEGKGAGDLLGEFSSEDDGLPWFQRQDFSMDAWLDDASPFLAFELVDGQVVSTPRSAFVPPWVASDAWQLRRAGILEAAVRARAAGASAPEAARPHAEPSEMPDAFPGPSRATATGAGPDGHRTGASAA